MGIFHQLDRDGIIAKIMTNCADWPKWLQILVFVPHGVLGFAMFWFWWPKTPQARRRFGFAATYLLVFYLLMRYGLKCW